MLIRSISLVLLLAGPAFGQRIDVLTGEKAKPRNPSQRQDPIILNAPHAPPQSRQENGGTPLEVYVVPQIGTGTAAGTTTATGVRPGYRRY